MLYLVTRHTEIIHRLRSTPYVLRKEMFTKKRGGSLVSGAGCDGPWSPVIDTREESLINSYLKANECQDSLLAYSELRTKYTQYRHSTYGLYCYKLYGVTKIKYDRWEPTSPSISITRNQPCILCYTTQVLVRGTPLRNMG
jgi:hypothetical protein